MSAPFLKSRSVKRTVSSDGMPQAKKQCTRTLDDMYVDYTTCKDRAQVTVGMKRSLLENGTPSVKKQRAIITAFDEVGEIYKRSASIDDVFKMYYVLCVFSGLGQLELDWRKQVHNIIDIWDQGVSLIIHELLHSLIWQTCLEESLPIDTFDYEKACRLAETEWRIELMLAVVERIIKWNDDDIDPRATELAVWDVAKHKIIINRSVCTKC